jgi:hypothetical protein
MSLPDFVPDLDVLLSMAPEELGAVIIEMMGPNGVANLPGLVNEAFSRSGDRGYPNDKRKTVFIAVAEAWTWLEGQGLLVWQDEDNGRNGWRRLSRRAIEIGNGKGIGLPLLDRIMLGIGSALPPCYRLVGSSLAG